MPTLPALLDSAMLALLAGVAGLDVVSFPQAMLSRPIVAATIGGAFVGAPIAGLVCGAVLECLALESLPVGASRYPEWGSASVIAGAIAAQGAEAGTLPGAAALAIATVVGIGAAWVGGWSMVQHRRLIAKLARPRLDQLAAGTRNTVVGLQVVGMTADLVRGTLIAAAALLIAMPIALAAEARWTLREDIARAVILTLGAGVAAAAVWKDFHAISGTRRLFLASLAVGTVLVFFRG